MVKNQLRREYKKMKSVNEKTQQRKVNKRKDGQNKNYKEIKRK